MTPFIHLTSEDGLALRINVAAITSYKTSGPTLPGGTSVVWEEANTLSMASVMEPISEIDRMIEEKFSE